MSVQIQQTTQAQTHTPASNTFPLPTLYVGDLDASVSESDLCAKFSTCGHVLSIRVCRDQITKHSLGYAYVNFQQQADAERALDTMNFDTINGRPMRIMWSQRDPALRKSGVGNVFIKNLDKSIDNKALYDTFSTFGNILSCKIMIDEHGNSKGYGFVHFETQEAADKAIKSVNNMLLNNKKVFVGSFMTKAERVSVYGDVKQKFTNVFIKNFSDKLDDNKLRGLFTQFGDITSAIVAKRDNGTSKGYGFVNFKDAQSAEKAVNEMNNYKIDDELTLIVCPFQKKSDRQKELKRIYDEKKREKYAQFDGVNLYIKNLDDKIDDDKLEKIFSPFGTITSAKVMIDQGRSKGFGFVCFKTREDATRAVSEMRGKLVESKPLYVALAQRKQERQSQLANYYKNRLAQLRTPLNTFSNHPVYYTNPLIHLYRPSATSNIASLGKLTQTQNTSFNTYQMITHQTMSTLPQRPTNSTLIRPQMYVTQSNFVKQLPTKQLSQAKQSINVPGQEPLTTNMLASAQPHEQKQMLGERIYQLVHSMFPEFAGKITGMLLEIDNAELIRMLDQQNSLKEKAQEAFNVLKAHQTLKTQIQH